MQFQDLWTWEGRIGPRAYAAWGFLLLAIKYGLDALVSWACFGQAWYPTSYIFFPANLSELADRDRSWFLTLLLIGLPFLWAGLVLTVKRLRSLDWSPVLALAFVVPFLNLVMFLLLSILSGEREPRPWRPLDPPRRPDPDRGSKPLAALIAVAIWGVLALPVTFLGVHWLEHYGWGVFVLLPMALGFLSAVVWEWRHHRTSSSTMGVSLQAALLALTGFFLMGIEGAICIIMATPIMLPVTLFGAMIGHLVMRERHSARRRATRSVSGMALLLPVLIGFEPAAAPPPPTFQVSSSVVIGAPRAEVWEHVVRFSPIPEPSEWMFLAGIAYPIEAEIVGTGVGAVRECKFSTGSFIEPIQVWDQPRLLRFGVIKCPPPMAEWTFYDEIHAPHLEGNFVATKGQFLLTELPGNRTLLTGTTWYHQRFWPVAYWRLWADHIIHRIHMRVLRHIKTEAEG